MTPAEFRKLFESAARDSEQKTGVPWQVTMAQAALESGWGKYAPGFNFFGIKADARWLGKRVLRTTREVIEGKSVYVNAVFRAYDTPHESFKDHGYFLRDTTNPQTGERVYARCFETETPQEFCTALQACGYASDPNYAATLIKIINRYFKD